MDHNKKIICAQYLDKNFIKEIISLFKKNELIDYIKIYNEFGLVSKDSIENVVLIEIDYNYLFSLKELLKNIKINYQFRNNKIWIHDETNKSDSIKRMLEKIPNNYNKEDIITVGDSSNDIEMIRDYNGYNIKNGTINKYLSNNKQTPNIRKLIKTYK